MRHLSLDNLKIINEFSKPYPIIVYSDLLDNLQIDNLQKSLSKENTIYDKTVMGNRKTLLKGTNNFKKFLLKNEIGKDINNFFESDRVFNFFYNKLQELNKKNNNYFDFRNKNFKFLKNYIKREGGFSFRIKNKITKTLFSLNNNCGVFCDFDFSVAGVGYGREPHHDVEERIVNFLFYINDFNGENGGNFQVYRYKNNPEKYLRQPQIRNVEVFKKIEPKRGYLITFLSSPNSLHGVDTIQSKNEKRYFFYGSYTSIKKIDWQKTSS